MKGTYNPMRLTLTIILLLLLATPSVPQSTSSQPSVLLEIVFQSTYLGGPNIETLRIYTDGRYILEGTVMEQAKSRKPRRVVTRREKQLEPGEMAELVDWAEQPDFLNAQPEYIVAYAHHGHSYTIVYRNKGREKKVRVANYSFGNEAERSKVPPSVLKLLKWLDPYYFELAEQKKN